MAGCNWKPPERTQRRDQYQCPHPVHAEHEKCIFHLPLETKRNNPVLVNKFKSKFDEFFDGDSLFENVYDFRGFAFPDGIDLIHRKFRRLHDDRDPIKFDWACFGHDTYLQYSHFGDGVSFNRCTFGENANFEHTVFGDDIRFLRTTFADNARFSSAQFGNDAIIYHTIFGDNAEFIDTVFGAKADFENTVFGNEALFNGANFGYNASFQQTNFGNQVEFQETTFGDQALFWSAKFGDRTFFANTVFGEGADFSSTVFNGSVLFAYIAGKEIVLHGQADWQDPEIPKKTITAMGEFRRSVPAKLIFKETEFRGFSHFHNSDLSQIRFQQVGLSNLSFFNSQISGTKFISCQWGSGPESRRWACRTLPWRFSLRRPRLLLDELFYRDRQIEDKEKELVKDLDHSLDPQIWLWNRIRLMRWQSGGNNKIRKFRKDRGIFKPDIDIQPSDIEVLALQLKQSLEATKDPIAAGDFHFAVMEMKRMQAMEAKHWGRAFMLWLYKTVNGYGERYGRTLLWLFFLLLISSGVFAHFGQVYFGKATFVDSIEPAAFYSLQHVLPLKLGTSVINEVREASPLMGWLTVIETIIGTTLFTFFALALRRRFKR